ncbi:MAG: SIR2 family protein [Phyllobacteriaceae bacterium]|jgi:tetratricopeptide (TPR) repeat protein|nr:SIR2 family protein [Phyllobacteriaceae bacterium]
MRKRKNDSALALPHILVEAIKDQRAVIVFGAGASKECRNPAGSTPPNGDQLRDHLAKKFLGVEKEERDLATVAEMAIANGAGQTMVFEEIANQLSGFEPSEAHQILADFRWRGLATTNYYTLIEQGYAKNPAKKQTCLPFVKDAEPYDDRLRHWEDPVALLKLHGCINHRLDPEIPLVLSNEHYHRYRDNREQLFGRLKQWAQASPLIFVGYRLADAHLRSLIYDIDPGKRPQWYIVSPGGDDHDRRFWATKSVDVIDGTFADFVSALNVEVPELFRALNLPEDAIDAPYRRHFRSNDAGSDLLRHSLQVDIEYIHSGVSFEEVTPEKFFSGHDKGWCCIVRDYDFRRKTAENLLYSALDELDERVQKLFVLQGSAGSGKTIALRRAAYDAATVLDELVVWLRDTGQPRAEVFEELYGLTGKHVLLFVDQISLHSDAILVLLRRLADKAIPITIIGSEREADWGSYCTELEEAYTPDLFTLRRLNEREAEDLVGLLERYDCLGQLQRRSKADRVAAFLDEDRADRQLLVALHELTQGKPFERIILEEFDRILRDAARQLYLDIATFHQFGVVARAGAISRISGIRFRDFEEEFFEPLRDIVSIVSDPYTGDKGYEARHTRVSRILFGVACPKDEDKARQLSRIITGLDAGFSSDKRVIENTCKGRVLAQDFSSIEAAREIFETAIRALPKSAFLYQQAAILEYLHSGGSLDRAQELAETAREIDDNNHIYIHTLAEVARRKANAADSRVLSEKLRAQSRSYLNEIWLKDARKDLSYCRLLIDEAVELLKGLPDEAKDHELIEFDDKVAEAVERLKRAQQDFPGEAEFPLAEGQLWQRLGQSEKASNAFKKAIGVRPRNTGAFARLSRIQKAGGSHQEAASTLEKALERFPQDKNVHMQLALLKVGLGSDVAPEAEFHFRSSFGPGDHHFDARFLFAEFLFWMGKSTEARDLFDEIDAKAPESFRRSAPASDDVITSKLGEYAGTIETVKDRFFFVRFGGYPAAVFAHMSSLVDLNFDELQAGTPVIFKIRFNRKGPVAVTVSRQ